MIKIAAAVATLALVMASGGCPKEGSPPPAQHQGHNNGPAPIPDPTVKKTGESRRVQYDVYWDEKQSPKVKVTYTKGAGEHVTVTRVNDGLGPDKRAHAEIVTSIEVGKTAYVLLVSEFPDKKTSATVEARVSGEKVCTDTNTDNAHRPGYGGVSCSALVR